MKTRSPAIIDFTCYESSVTAVCDRIGAGPVLADQSAVLIKPNLVTDSPYPVTTSPECCGAIIDYIRAHSSAAILIAEGTGDPCRTGMDVFARLGYTRLARDKQVTLIDLNTEPVVRLENPECPRFPEFYIPQIALDHFIVSVPVLKAHSLSQFTGTLKNMVGFAPPAHYAGDGGIWNKAAFHVNIQQAIIDANRYRRADLTILDAAVGLADYHLGGRRCEPPVGKLIAGFDPVAVDRLAAGLLGLDWREIGHLAVEYPD